MSEFPKMKYDQLLKVLDLYCMGYVLQKEAAWDLLENLNKADDLADVDQAVRPFVAEFNTITIEVRNLVNAELGKSEAGKALMRAVDLPGTKLT